MKARNIFGLTFLILFSLCLGRWSGYSQSQRPRTTQWEYMSSTLKDPELPKTDAILGGFGREGWEMVAVSTDGRTFYFKRPL